MSEIKRNIGIFGAASVGIANIIGAGIFVLSGVDIGIAGPTLGSVSNAIVQQSKIPVMIVA